MKGKEILYCNLLFTDKKRNFKLNKVVYVEADDKMFFDKRLTKEFKIKNPVLIDSVEIIQKLGHQNKKNEIHRKKKQNNK
tara:strand:- start:798 stop:1037 length:240 start_codon:yes stop_codon:yes gene_type:complete